MIDPQAVTQWSKSEGFDALAELALNLHRSWNHAADELWEWLGPGLWEDTLQKVSRDRIQAELATPQWDAADAEQLYSLLEPEVVPQFYERNEAGIPSKWLVRVRERMARLTLEFSAGRTIREYTNNHYLPAASRYSERASEDSAAGASLVQWQHDIACHWNTVDFGTVDIQTHDGRHFFRVEVFSGELRQKELQVELYADPVRDGEPSLKVMTASNVHEDSPGMQSYVTDMPAARPASDYTVRVCPYHASAVLPLEASQILWQRSLLSKLA